MPAVSSSTSTQRTKSRKSLDLSKQTVVVLGGGTMGRMIALRYALAGAKVTIIDPNEGVLSSARRRHEQTLLQAVIPGEKDQGVLSRITYLKGNIGQDRAANAALRKASLVIEAVYESLEVKREVFQILDRYCKTTALLVSNSSSHLIDEIITRVKHKERCCNTHYLQEGMAPVEVMRGRKTEDWAHKKILAFLTESHQVPIQVLKENKGFVFNIIWRGIKKSCLDLIERGVSTPQEIDRIWMMAFRTKIGPCAVMDMVGLDVVADIEDSYFESSKDPRDKPPSFLVNMVEQGNLGMKTGRGFYAYRDTAGNQITPAYTLPGFLEAGENARHAKNILPIRESLLGSWQLQSFTSEDAEGKVIDHPMGKNALGILSYNVDGSMSVTLYSPNRSEFAGQDTLKGTVEEKAAAFSSMFSYFGRFRVGKGCISHDIAVCSFPNWSDKKQLHFARFERGALVLSTPPITVNGQPGVQKLVWTRT